MWLAFGSEPRCPSVRRAGRREWRWRSTLAGNGARDRPGGSELPVHGLQHVPERAGMAWCYLGDERERAESVTLVLVAAGELGEARQPYGGAGGTRRDGGVIEVLAPDDQRFA